MTNKQAATKLLNILNDDIYAWSPEILEAFSMAVDALKGTDVDCTSRADVNRVLEDWFRTVFGVDSFRKTGLCRELRELPSAQSEQTDCIYCHEDSDGYVTPLERNCHAFIHFGMNGWELSLQAKGWHGSAKIRYCPMCGRRLTHG